MKVLGWTFFETQCRNCT